MLNESRLKNYIRSFIKNFTPSNENLGQNQVVKKIPKINSEEFHELLYEIASTLYEGYGSKKHFKQLSKAQEDFFGDESDILPEFYSMFKSEESHNAFREIISNEMQLNPSYKEEDKLYNLLNDYYDYHYSSSDNHKIFNPQKFSKELSSDCEIFLQMLKIVE